MAVTLSTAARNAAADAIVDLVDGGSGDSTGDFQFLDGASPIVIIDTAATAFGAAATGVATLAGVPLSGTATGDSSSPGIDVFNVRNKSNATIFSGSCSGAGGGGDIEFDNAIVLTDQVVNLTSLTFTMPAS